jgi:hypothetical protein
LTDEVPIASTYKGTPIFAGQSRQRVALVKREIDKVNKLSDLQRLFEIAGDCAWSPESRILAGARCVAGLELATERREAKPDIDREDIEARTAGLASSRWTDPGPCRNAATGCAKPTSVVLLRKPITGIAGCCARAASGHATAAPPRSVMKSRRFTAQCLPCFQSKG